MAPALLAALLALAAGSASAHMMMSSPVPRQAPGNPGANGEIDYSYTAPLGAFPCKGYPAQTPKVSVAAGSSLPVTISGGANHGGGHCQFSLSYDGSNFVTIDTVIRDCLRSGGQTFNVAIPSSAPSGRATFAWTWFNAVGNREMYMNCADIDITGGSGAGGSLTGRKLVVANIPGSSINFGEFGSNGVDDNRAVFQSQPQITVTGNGGSTNSGTSSGAPRQTDAAPSATPSPTEGPRRNPSRGTRTQTASGGPAQAPTPTEVPSGACSRQGAYKCEGASQFALCTAAGTWAAQPVPDGTACKANGEGSILFVRA